MNTHQTQQHEQQQQAAEAAARKLRMLLNSTSVSQLLQQPPPAAATGQKASTVAGCCGALRQLYAALQGQRAAAAGSAQILQAVLQQKAAQSVGTLLSWVLQRPQQLQVKLGPGTAHQLHEPGAVFLHSCAILHTMTAAVRAAGKAADMATACSTMLQQLDQSGGLLSCIVTLQMYMHAYLEHASLDTCAKWLLCNRMTVCMFGSSSDACLLCDLS
jgi:hypothetical protein